MSTQTITLAEFAALKGKTRQAVTNYCWNFTNLNRPMPAPALRAWKDDDGHWLIEIETSKVSEVAA